MPHRGGAMRMTPGRLASLLPLACVILLCCAKPQPCGNHGVDGGPAASASHGPTQRAPTEPSPAFACDAERFRVGQPPKPPAAPSPAKPSHTVSTKEAHGVAL